MNKSFIRIAAITGALAVILGAFAAHTLKTILIPDHLQIFETAVKYQFYHAFALLAAGILYKEFPVASMRRAGRLFITGIILFSGSLYVLCIVKHYQLPLNWVGAVTPFGGAAFIAGWIMLFWATVKRN